MSESVLTEEHKIIIAAFEKEREGFTDGTIVITANFWRGVLEKVVVNRQSPAFQRKKKKGPA